MLTPEQMAMLDMAAYNRITLDRWEEFDSWARDEMGFEPFALYRCESERTGRTSVFGMYRVSKGTFMYCYMLCADESLDCMEVVHDQSDAEALSLIQTLVGMNCGFEQGADVETMDHHKIYGGLLEINGKKLGGD